VGQRTSRLVGSGGFLPGKSNKDRLTPFCTTPCDVLKLESTNPLSNQDLRGFTVPEWRRGTNPGAVALGLGGEPDGLPQPDFRISKQGKVANPSYPHPHPHPIPMKMAAFSGSPRHMVSPLGSLMDAESLTSCFTPVPRGVRHPCAPPRHLPSESAIFSFGTQLCDVVASAQHGTCCRTTSGTSPWIATQSGETSYGSEEEGDVQGTQQEEQERGHVRGGDGEPSATGSVHTCPSLRADTSSAHRPSLPSA
jgi:hypothetical protein